jgi:hypothetical protein
MSKILFENQIKIPNKNVPNLTRRNFLSSCSACAACMAITPLSFVNTSCSTGNNDKKMRIRILYSLHEPVQNRPDWPNVGFDFNPVMEQFKTVLSKTFSNFEFIPTVAKGAEEAEKIAKKDVEDSIDGYIVYQMNCWNQVVQTIAKTGKPVLYADFQFGGSGGFLVYSASFLRANTPNVGIIASSNIEDMIAAVSCFMILKNGGSTSDFVSAVSQARIKATKLPEKYSLTANNVKFLSPEECIRRLASSKIIAIRDQKSEIAKPVMGIPVEYIPFSEVNAAWSTADKGEAAGIVERWKKSAQAIIGVPHETLLTSASMYLGMKSVLKKHGANAITINCLGGFYGGHILPRVSRIV